MHDPDWYNESSAAKLGWDPSWFGCDFYDSDLVRAVMRFQHSHKMTADGLAGPSTFRRIFAEREANIDQHDPTPENRADRHIVYNGNLFPIEWPKVVLWSEPNGLKAAPGNYRDQSGNPPRDVRMFINHWDVCVSSHSCQRVLDRRGISVHFLLDADGTIYQTMDCQHVGFHAGSRSANNWSIGVEINNAFYPKYQGHYEKRGLGPRPILIDSVVNGRTLERHMGFYPVQIEALKALWRAVHLATGVPLACPMRGPQMSTDTEGDVASGSFRGLVHHFHLTARKIDAASIWIDQLLEEM